MPKRGENIYKRKDGRWEGRYATGEYTNAGNPRFRSVYGKTYGEVKAKLREYRVQPKKKQGQEEMTLAKGCDIWLQQHKTAIKESTYQRYRTIIENHIKPDWGKRKPGDMDSAGFTQYGLLLLNRGLSQGTVRNILSLFRMVLEDMSREGEAIQIPAKVALPREKRTKPRVLSAAEYERLTAYLLQEASSVHLGILLALECGMRIGEICALRWSALSLSDGILHIGATLQRLSALPNEAEKKTRLVEGPPKSDSSIRDIPLTGELLLLCQKLCPENRSAFVLTGTVSPMEPRSLQYRLTRICKQCQLSGVHFHTLRHTFATRCARSGVELKSLSEILGHATTRITLDRYVHPSFEMKRSNLEKLKLASY